MKLKTKSFNFVNNYAKYFLVIPALIMLFFIPFFRTLGICIALIFIGVYSLSYQRYVKYFGIELVFFSTLMSSLLFGNIIGIAVGITSYIIGQYLVGQITPYSIITIIGIIISATLSPILFAFNLSIVLLSLIVRIISLSLISIGWVLLGFDLKDTIFTGVINLVFNLIIFSTFGNLIYGALR